MASIPTVGAGVVRIVTGDARVGEYLVHHHGVDDVHITGSESTYDARVTWSAPQTLRRVADTVVVCHASSLGPRDATSL
jgi:acyl-CoA reductase-like NAD-dependent aldehyde dehydrogenase